MLFCGVDRPLFSKPATEAKPGSLVRGLFDHPHRPRWMPGNGGLALHSIVLDPRDNQRMYVAIWRAVFTGPTMADLAGTPQNQGIRAMTMPEKYPVLGSVCIKWSCPFPTVRRDSFCKVIGDCTARITVPRTGTTLPTVCPLLFWLRYDYAPKKSRLRVYRSS